MVYHESFMTFKNIPTKLEDIYMGVKSWHLLDNLADSFYYF